MCCSQTGLCYAVWVDPAKVSDVASVVMAEAGLSLPHLLANRVRALCFDQMGRKFDSIMKRMPQVPNVLRVVYNTKVIVVVVNHNNQPQVLFFSFILVLCEFLCLWLIVGSVL